MSDMFDKEPRMGDPYHVVLQKEHAKAMEKHMQTSIATAGPYRQRSTLTMLLGVLGVGLGALASINSATNFLTVAASAIAGALIGMGIGWSLVRIPMAIGWAWETTTERLFMQPRKTTGTGPVCASCGAQLYGTQVSRCFKCGAGV